MHGQRCPGSCLKAHHSTLWARLPWLQIRAGRLSPPELAGSEWLCPPTPHGPLYSTLSSHLLFCFSSSNIWTILGDRMCPCWDAFHASFKLYWAKTSWQFEDLMSSATWQYKVKPTGFYFQFQARCEAEFWGKCLQAYLEFISFDAIDHMEAIGKPECRTAVYKVIWKLC